MTRKYNFGNKAQNLYILRNNGINVPKFFCISSDMVLSKEAKEKIMDTLEKELTTNSFAIRSSSNVEDSDAYSFAGQFLTYLNVKKDDVISKIEECRGSVNIRNIQEYLNSKEKVKMNVIVQEMVSSDYSGVIFTANPQGILNETVIVVGRGVGENVVMAKVPTTSYYYNTTDDVYYYEKQLDSPTLSDECVRELIEISKKIKEIFKSHMDIEFGIKDGKIYILQARKITTIDTKNKIVLDSSNIVESYPNLTLPMTISFIKNMYYEIFKAVLLRITNDKEVTFKFDNVLKNIIAVYNGRVYYEINNLYNILLLLPFTTTLIPIWQEMLGVEQKEIDFDKNLKIPLRVKKNVVKSFFNLLKENVTQMQELQVYFIKIEEYYEKEYNKNLDNVKLDNLYKSITQMVMKKWDITLVNDMYAFIYTGLLKRQLKKENSSDGSGSVIADISNLESMKPVINLIALSKYAKENNMIDEMNTILTNQDYYNYIQENEGRDLEFKKMIKDYIKEYGDRNVEELKLESKTFRTDPYLLIQKIIDYANNDEIDKYLKLKEKKSKDYSKYSKKTQKYIKKAKEGIAYREKSRLSRSKMYGYMRQIVLTISKNFVSQKIINNIDDIFYLYYEEIENIIQIENNNRLKDEDIKEIRNLIDSRKSEYKMYEKLPFYSRVIFQNEIKNKRHENINSNKVNGYEDKDTFYGISCSFGKVTGEVVLIDKTTDLENVDTKGKIIVTKMTDPGWVYQITKSIGIVSEKGSLLSHSAIISRELKKPAIVGVKDITKILKNGDKIVLDADSATIKKIN